MLYEIWLIGIPIVYVLFSFVMGIFNRELDYVQIVVPSILISLLWPAIFGVIIGYIVLTGPAKLGRYLFNREKRNA